MMAALWIGEDTMKIAAFNVENLFDRPKAFNLEDHERGAAITDAVAEFNVLINKEVYEPADKARMLVLIELLKLTATNPAFVIFRKIRGALWKKPRNGPLEIVANGRADWVGWVELKTEPNNAVAVMNSGRVIKEVGADILAVIEAEDRVALMQFSDQVLRKLGGEPYDEIMLIDGNDSRGIDVGLMVTNGYSVGLMRSHIADILPNGERVFSRDCPEYQVITPSGESIWVLPNHFKSKFGGNDRGSIAKRAAQAARTAEIYEALRARGEDKIVVLGDFNDTPDSAPLQRLLAQTDLKEITDHPKFSPGTFSGIGTYATGTKSHKIDYLLLSPALFARVTAAGLFRKGAWSASKRWEMFPELDRHIHAASDHHLIWAEIAD
jgi:endonuclease/exonuclease/phosphatase family metal-dependent hydrolase